jgi:hypothetical protein
LTEAAARGERDLFYLDQCGVAPSLPLSYTWARVGVRPLARYEAPQRRRVNVLGALAPVGPRPGLVFESRLAAEGKLDVGPEAMEMGYPQDRRFFKKQLAAKDLIVPALTKLYRDGGTPISILKEVTEQVNASQR